MWRVFRWMFWLGFLILIGLFLVPFFGVTSCGSHFMPLLRVVQAIERYHAEYGHYPDVSKDGLIETESANARLVKILSGDNPKGIKFYTFPTSGKFLSKNGAFLDYSGHFYRFRIDVNGDGAVANPYTGELLENTPVIGWAVGPDGTLDDPKNKDVYGDVISWRKFPTISKPNRTKSLGK